jgi:hypothetical protein
MRVASVTCMRKPAATTRGFTARRLVESAHATPRNAITPSPERIRGSRLSPP